MNAVTVFNPAANLPAHLRKGELSDLTKALAGGASTTKRLSIKGGVFRLMVGAKQVAAIDERYLDVILVSASPKVGRTWYAAKFAEEEAPKAPDCWSANGDQPDPSSPKIQSQQCATCPQNVSGSGEGDTKSCRYNQKLALTLANDQEGDVLQLIVPAKSIFGKEENGQHPLQSYARFMAAQGVSVDTVITRLKFDTNSSSPKLFFKPMRWLSEDEYATAQEKGKSPDALLAIASGPENGAAAPAAIPGTPPGAAAAAPKPTPAPVDDEPPPPPPAAKKTRTKKDAAPAAAAPADEPPPPEPTVRTKAPTASAPVAPGSLAATVAAWDDED
jgi:hypothetical protein